MKLAGDAGAKAPAARSRRRAKAAARRARRDGAGGRTRQPADLLIIKGLVAEGRVGVYEWERQAPQQIWIDATLSINAAKAASRDDVRDAVDYGKLVSALKERVAAKPVKLLETLAEDLASLVLKEFPVPRVTLRVKKRALPGVDYAAVEVTRP